MLNTKTVIIPIKITFGKIQMFSFVIIITSIMIKFIASKGVKLVS